MCSLQTTIYYTAMQNVLASFPGLPHLQFLIACSVQKAGGVEGLGTRLGCSWYLKQLFVGHSVQGRRCGFCIVTSKLVQKQGTHLLFGHGSHMTFYRQIPRGELVGCRAQAHPNNPCMNN